MSLQRMEALIHAGPDSTGRNQETHWSKQGLKAQVNKSAAVG